MNNNININWNVCDSVKVLVTTKNFLSNKNFNISYTNNEYNKTKKDIDFLSDKILPSYPNFIKQAHGKKIVNLDEQKIHSHVADGIITSKKKQVIAVQTADCMPIVISSVCGSIVCILHAGRKGVEYNIINSAFEILKKYNYSYEAWIGPSISKDYYIVDDNIKKSFIKINKKYENFFYRNNSQFNMDLLGIASLQLNENNVKNIFYSDMCTVKNKDNFYSYRNSSDQKRFGTFAWIEDKKKGDK